MANRKDAKGRVLKAGESQRKDGTYMYRYTDVRGKRRSIYSPDLQELRKKEKAIQKDLDDGIDYAAGNITVFELIEKYLKIKQGIKPQSATQYRYKLNQIKSSDFGNKKISTIKKSDVVEWVVSLYDAGKKPSTIKDYIGLLKPAFAQACDDDILRRNPFEFKIKDYIPSSESKAIALTDEEQKLFMEFVQGDSKYKKYYDEFLVMLETGLRISELRGLTFSDLDFQNRKIYVTHQLSAGGKNRLHVIEPKSKKGYRTLYMTDTVYESLKRIIANRPVVSTETMIDGYCGFIFIGKDGYPQGITCCTSSLKRMVAKYNKEHQNSQLPNITPHTFRHTFCTNMIKGGMDIKSLQYLMGHSDPAVTLKVYSHSNEKFAIDQMKKVIDARDAFTIQRQKTC